MPSLRELLADDPFLPEDAREAIARGEDARARLVELGLNRCEAAELLGYACDEPPLDRDPAVR